MIYLVWKSEANLGKCRENTRNQVWFAIHGSEKPENVKDGNHHYGNLPD